MFFLILINTSTRKIRTQHAWLMLHKGINVIVNTVSCVSTRWQLKTGRDSRPQPALLALVYTVCNRTGRHNAASLSCVALRETKGVVLAAMLPYTALALPPIILTLLPTLNLWDFFPYTYTYRYIWTVIPQYLIKIIMFIFPRNSHADCIKIVINSTLKLKLS